MNKKEEAIRFAKQTLEKLDNACIEGKEALYDNAGELVMSGIESIKRINSVVAELDDPKEKRKICIYNFEMKSRIDFITQLICTKPKVKA